MIMAGPGTAFGQGDGSAERQPGDQVDGQPADSLREGAGPSTQNPAPQAAGTTLAPIEAPIHNLDEPLYSPFTARYILDEVRILRTDLERTRADLIERQVTREYAIARDASSYAQRAVELFFYIITAITTLLVFLGWKSLRDAHERVREIAENRVETLVAGYSERLDTIEAELRLKSQRLKEAQEEIDETNEIQSLWLRASQETTPSGKIAVYDEIMKLRPGNTEAITYKADAALQLSEPQWALSLANRALESDPENAHALYQRACAYAFIGAPEEALADLGAAIGILEAYREQARSDPAFETLIENETFKALTQWDDHEPPAEEPESAAGT